VLKDRRRIFAQLRSGAKDSTREEVFLVARVFLRVRRLHERDIEVSGIRAAIDIGSARGETL